MRTFTVLFEEEGKEIEVTSYCRRCWPGLYVPEPKEIEVVSRYGTGHCGADYGFTACGIDATGDGWWHRL